MGFVILQRQTIFGMGVFTIKGERFIGCRFPRRRRQLLMATAKEQEDGFNSCWTFAVPGVSQPVGDDAKADAENSRGRPAAFFKNAYSKVSTARSGRGRRVGGNN